MPEGFLNLSTFLGLGLGLLLGFGLAALTLLKKSKSLTIQPTPLTETGHLLAGSEAQAVPTTAPSPEPTTAPKLEAAGPQAGDGIVLALLGLRGGSGKSILAVALAEAWDSAWVAAWNPANRPATSGICLRVLATVSCRLTTPRLGSGNSAKPGITC